jgi:probable HAF family extracellular repeat protein
LAVLFVTGLLACAGAASTASTPKFQLVWSHGAAGTELRLAAVASDGSAAGTFRHQDMSQHAVFFNGRTVKEIGSKIGPGSVVTGMNDRHQIVGYRSVRPNVTTGDLLSSKLAASQKPHAFLYGGGRTQVLTQPSYATAVNDEGVVVGTFLASDQSQHAFAWLTGGLRWAPVLKNKFIDLGASSARAVNSSSTSWNVEITGPADAAARYYTLNVLTGKFTTRTVNLAGAITTVNTASRGGGYQLSQSTHDQLPVLVNLHTGRMTALGLPAPFTSGVVNVVTDAGDPFGDLFNQSDLEAVTWVNGRPVDLNSWFTKAQLLGHKLTGIADANTNGQFVGTAEVSGDTWAYIASPTPAYELANVVAWVAQTSQSVFARGTRRAVTKAYGASKRGASADSCQYVHQAVAANYADLRRVGFYPRNALIDDLDEIAYELRCGGKITPPHGMPFHR